MARIVDPMRIVSQEDFQHEILNCQSSSPSCKGKKWVQELWEMYINSEAPV